ncbi:hypothetical protein [Planosporangium mesophilum]|uniref:Uncharacterized protein n=1 Tax=Planosporangium mesophilum TaxID=689768 RepID=A0A8J3TIP1_9ACTN|nr:hypothetical protein [Planosporangium mesophilum]NJC86758.1 hypothetical protein [Planosporangium mesophilum]GII26447.1 hypothetical protein Pme01_60440 [Planosporangium mesophilum]
MQATLLAGLAGLIGIILGRLWDTRSESRRWRRDQRMQSYQAVAGEFYRYREAIRELGHTARPGQEHDERSAEVHQLRTDWNRTLAALWLHGSERAVQCALAVDHQLAELRIRATAAVITDEDWPTRREPAQMAYDNFIDAIRHDLALSPLKSLRAGAARRSAPPPTQPAQ